MLEINEQAACHTVLCGSPRGYRDKEVPGRIVAADFVLDVQDVLPLQESRKADVKPDHIVFGC